MSMRSATGGVLGETGGQTAHGEESYGGWGGGIGGYHWYGASMVQNYNSPKFYHIRIYRLQIDQHTPQIYKFYQANPRLTFPPRTTFKPIPRANWHARSPTVHSWVYILEGGTNRVYLSHHPDRFFSLQTFRLLLLGGTYLQ